jgi:hypothetical protein
MTSYFTMTEAARQSGRSPSSIRRIIYPIIANDKHPDRGQVAPSVEEVKSLRVKGENFAWKISEELLRREIPVAETKTGGPLKAASTDASPGAAAIIEVLTRELEIKNQQISTQNELLKGLSERLREGNILIGSLQQQLSLGDGARPGGVVDTMPTTPKPAPAKKSKPNRGFFQRIFPV